MITENSKRLSKLLNFNILYIFIALFLYVCGVYFKDSAILSAAIIIFFGASHNYSNIKIFLTQPDQKDAKRIDRYFSIIGLILLIIQIFIISR